VVTRGTERGGWCEVGKAHPATAGLEEDEAKKGERGAWYKDGRESTQFLAFRGKIGKS
jgi:hypothetical protein